MVLACGKVFHDTPAQCHHERLYAVFLPGYPDYACTGRQSGSASRNSQYPNPVSTPAPQEMLDGPRLIFRCVYSSLGPVTWFL